jgi:hypothetical protein
MDEKMELNEATYMTQAAMARGLSAANPENPVPPPPIEDPAANERSELKTRTYENLGEHADFWNWADDEQQEAFGNIDPYEAGIDMEKLKEELVAFVVENAFIDDVTARTKIVR